jgi:hypothetical protein
LTKPELTLSEGEEKASSRGTDHVATQYSLYTCTSRDR